MNQILMFIIIACVIILFTIVVIKLEKIARTNGFATASSSISIFILPYNINSIADIHKDTVDSIKSLNFNNIFSKDKAAIYSTLITNIAPNFDELYKKILVYAYESDVSLPSRKEYIIRSIPHEEFNSSTCKEIYDVIKENIDNNKIIYVRLESNYN